MQKVFPNCAGLDVHKKFVVACRLTVDDQGHIHRKLLRFSTMTKDLEALSNWLAQAGCSHVAMESTGIYWQPVYNILEGSFEVYLVNAKHVKHVPGRKSDIQDAQWLAELLQHGLLKPSFIPPRQQRQLRDLVRYRQGLFEERNRITNRIQKVLEDANIKLSSVVSDIRGVSAQAILRELLAGQQDPQKLAQLARGRLKAKRTELEQALCGRLGAHHRFLLVRLLAHLDFLDEEISALQGQIEVCLARMPSFCDAVDRLDTIPGVDRHTATLIVAEIGVDMSRFPSDRHLTSWAGLAPGSNETGGKHKPARTRKGNRYLRRGLVQAARAAARTRGTYLNALYHRIASRRGKNRAAVAVARTILQICYHLISQGQTYRDLGVDYFDRLDRERTTKRLVRRLEALGFQVTL